MSNELPILPPARLQKQSMQVNNFAPVKPQKVNTQLSQTMGVISRNLSSSLDSVGQILQEKIDKDKVTQQRRYYEGKGLSDDATVAGEKTYNRLSYADAALPEINELVLRSKQEEWTDEEFDEEVANTRKAILTKTDGSEEAQAVVGELIHKNMPTFVANHVAQKNVKRIQDRSEVFMGRVQTAIHDQNLTVSPTDPDALKESKVKKLASVIQQIDKEGDDLKLPKGTRDKMTAYIIANSQQDDPYTTLAMVQATKLIKDDKGLSLFDRNPNIGKLEEQAKRQATLEHPQDTAAKISQVDAYIRQHGDMDYEDFVENVEKDVGGFKNKFGVTVVNANMLRQRWQAARNATAEESKTDALKGYMSEYYGRADVGDFSERFSSLGMTPAQMQKAANEFAADMRTRSKQHLEILNDNNASSEDREAAWNAYKSDEVMLAKNLSRWGFKDTSAVKNVMALSSANINTIKDNAKEGVKAKLPIETSKALADLEVWSEDPALMRAQLGDKSESYSAFWQRFQKSKKLGMTDVQSMIEAQKVFNKPIGSLSKTELSEVADQTKDMFDVHQLDADEDFSSDYHTYMGVPSMSHSTKTYYDSIIAEDANRIMKQQAVAPDEAVKIAVDNFKVGHTIKGANVWNVGDDQLGQAMGYGAKQTELANIAAKDLPHILDDMYNGKLPEDAYYSLADVNKGANLLDKHGFLDAEVKVEKNGYARLYRSGVPITGFIDLHAYGEEVKARKFKTMEANHDHSLLGMLKSTFSSDDTWRYSGESTVSSESLGVLETDVNDLHRMDNPDSYTPTVTKLAGAHTYEVTETDAGDHIANFIMKKEAGAAGYNAVNSGKTGDYSGNKLPAGKQLTDMSVGDVLEMQRGWQKKGAASTAVGALQFRYQTLKEMAQKLNISPDAKFNKAMQNYLGLMVIRLHRPAAWKAISSKDPLTPAEHTKALLELSKEWASFPDPRTGKSYYNGVGDNKVLFSVKDAEEFIQTMRGLNYG